jgi:hypothetical protein
MPKRQHILSTLQIARALLEHKHTPCAELKSACAQYLASLHTHEARKAAALKTPADERKANARAAITARWTGRPEGQLPYDQAAILARLDGMESAEIPATGIRRQAALAALVAAGRIRILSEAGGRVTISAEPGKTAKP